MVIDIYQEIARIIADGERAAVATIVATRGSTAREAGTKMLVREDGSTLGTIGGGIVESQVIKQALEVIKSGKPQSVHFSPAEAEEGRKVDIACGGESDIFIEPVQAPPALCIFGGGHISLVLAKAGKMLGFRIVVIDDRPEYASKKRFPDADLILAEDFVKSFDRLWINETDYIVIVTHGHRSDEMVLERALKTTAQYIGMIGSKAKVKTIFAHLMERGISRERLDAVHSPIGLDIGAETPEEIAISILAEVIKIRRAP